MSSARPRAAQGEWFMPEPMAGWLGHGLGADLIGQMLRHDRLRRHLDRLVTGRIGAVDAAPGAEIGAALLGLDHLGLLAFVRRLGAVWHAPRITAAIDGETVRRLVVSIGPSLRQAAIRHAGLRPAQAAADAVPDHELAQRIPRDGLCCLTAWADQQPDAIRSRIALRAGTAAEIAFAHRRHGPALVEGLVRAELLDAPPASAT